MTRPARPQDAPTFPPAVDVVYRAGRRRMRLRVGCVRGARTLSRSSRADLIRLLHLAGLPWLRALLVAWRATHVRFDGAGVTMQAIAR